jgi:hypothetical protein
MRVAAPVTSFAVLALLQLAPLPAVGPPPPGEARPGPPATIGEPRPTELDLTGAWLLKHVIRRSERPAYRGLTLDFRVELVQRGDRISGVATKWRENGRELPPAARSRLELDGRVEGDEIVGRYTETSQGRRSGGRFRWRYSIDEGLLHGSFESSVASAAGDATVVAIG